MARQFPYDKFKKGLIKCGLKEDTYDEYLPVWIKENGDTEVSRKDYIWHLYQLLLTSIAKECSTDADLWVKLKFVYCEMDGFLLQENRSRYVAMKGIANCDLQNAASTGLKLDAVIIGGNRCPEAEKLNDKRYPLLVGGCNCCYAFESVRDEDGRLIKQIY